MPKTIIERKRSVELLLGAASHKPRTGVLVGLLTSNPTINGNTDSEPKTAGYERGTANNWSVDDHGTASNSTAVTISQVPGGVYRYWAIFTTDNQMISFDALPWPLEVLNTEDIVIQPGNLTILEA